MWEKKPALSDEILDMGCVIAVGFGSAGLFRDDKFFMDGEFANMSGKKFRVKDAEEIAKKDPNHSWVIIWNGPLSYEEYQRHEEGVWKLIVKGDGFA